MTSLQTAVLVAVLAVPVLTIAQSPAPELKASMIVLGVHDLSRAVNFYKDTLSLPAAPAPGDLPMFQSGTLTIVLNPALATPGTSTGGFEIVFPVASVTATQKQLEERGCRFLRSPRQISKDLWAATFTDPDDHQLTLFGAH